MPLVQVGAPGQGCNACTGGVSTHDQFAGMTDDRGRGPLRNVVIRHDDRVTERIGEVAKAGTEHDGHVGRRAAAASEDGYGRVEGRQQIAHGWRVTAFEPGPAGQG